MASLEPRGMNDLTGWQPLTCGQADVLMERHRDLPGFEVASGLTDIDGIAGSSVLMFREWWYAGAPLLRDYRYHGGKHCEHYGAIDATAAVERES